MINEGTTSKADEHNLRALRHHWVNEALHKPQGVASGPPNNHCGTSLASIVEQLVAEATDVQSFVFMCISLCVEHDPIGTTGGSEETIAVQW